LTTIILQKEFGISNKVPANITDGEGLSVHLLGASHGLVASLCVEMVHVAVDERSNEDRGYQEANAERGLVMLFDKSNDPFHGADSF
jgi:hypothetical protein